ncbi:hypothetical protein DFH06DRAFT_1151638 [Mycena polygramma]|nr:hypothetical protein DFH06DRAFT_1151638 [Mycena polygramma]
MSVNDNPNPQSALVGTSQINSCRDLILWIPYRPAALYWSQGGTTTQALLQQGEPYNFTPLLAVDANLNPRVACTGCPRSIAVWTRNSASLNLPARVTVTRALQKACKIVPFDLSSERRYIIVLQLTTSTQVGAVRPAG